MIYLLHISDLHLVVNAHWNNMKEAILASVREKLQGVPRGQKLLVITGDFHNFVEKDYTQAETFLPQLWGLWILTRRRMCSLFRMALYLRGKNA